MTVRGWQPSTNPLPTATDLDAEIFHAARSMFRVALEDVRRRDRGVRLIGVAATNLGTASEEDLFETRERTRLRRLTAAVDALRAQFGFDALTSGDIFQLRGGKRKPGSAPEITRDEPETH